ncbi:MAG: ABC transporter permease, partial [Terriglobia bacterium]
VTLDVGFDRNNVLLVQADLGAAKIPADRQAATWQEIESRLSTLPGVLSAARSLVTPISGNQFLNNSVHTDWTKMSPGWGDDNKFLVSMDFISPDYLPTLRMHLLAGRNFTGADMRSSRPIAIVDQTFARRFFPGLNPIGRTYLVGAPVAHRVEVVGLVEDSKYLSLREENRPVAFLPINQIPPYSRNRQTVELRTASRRQS